MKPPDDHYTKVPNVFFDDILKHLNMGEVKVYLYLARHTFGYQKDVDKVSLSQFCKGIKRSAGKRLDSGTGLARGTVIAALRSLESKEIIVRRKGRGTIPHTYEICEQ